MACRLLLAVALLSVSAPALAAQDLLRTHRRACDGGEIRMCTVLGLIYESGAAGDRDMERAMELYQRACDQEIAAGCARLALAQAAPPVGTRENGYVRVGYIADSESGAPVSEAVVEIPLLGIRLLADEAGRVDFGRLPRGRHTVTAGRLGYIRVEGDLPVPWDTDFMMLLDRTVQDEGERVGGIFGRVKEEGTGRDLQYVDITLAGNPPIQLVTGVDGRFSLSGLDPGPVDVTFALIGYEPRTTTIAIEPGETIELHATLSTQAIELEPIEVLVGSRYLDRNGFYRRSRQAIGTQFTRRDLIELDPIDVTEVLLRAPGVEMQVGRNGSHPVSSRREGAIGQGACRLRVYIDGVSLFEFDIGTLRPDDLEGIEVYHGASVPVEYQRLVDPDGVYPCGAVLVWTRRD
jgi:hypothetical protein